jgi:hypothetical protein
MSGAAKLRTWFLRNLLEAAERELGAAQVSALPARAPARLRPHLSLDRLRASAALDAIPLDEGEEALVALDQILGDGSGKTLERVGCEMLARQLVQAVAAVRVGDLYGTVARLRGPLEHPFVDASLTFELERTPQGLTLTVGVTGRPRATRLLGHLASAAIVAAERFAREAHADPLRIETKTFADRARIDAYVRRASSAPPPTFSEPITISRRSAAASLRGTSLSEEVARILDPSLPRERGRSPSGEPLPRRPSSGGMPAVRPEGAPSSHRSAGPQRDSIPPPLRDSTPPPKRDSVPPPGRGSTPPPKRDSAPPPRRDSTPTVPAAAPVRNGSVPSAPAPDRSPPTRRGR